MLAIIIPALVPITTLPSTLKRAASAAVAICVLSPISAMKKLHSIARKALPAGRREKACGSILSGTARRMPQRICPGCLKREARRSERSWVRSLISVTATTRVETRSACMACMGTGRERPMAPTSLAPPGWRKSAPKVSPSQTGCPRHGLPRAAGMPSMLRRTPPIQGGRLLPNDRGRDPIRFTPAMQSASPPGGTSRRGEVILPASEARRKADWE
jgi:hypothetical protein